MGERQGPYRAGQLAHLAGVSTDTLRYYERRGLLPLPPRSDSGYRLYPAAAPSKNPFMRCLDST